MRTRLITLAVIVGLLLSLGISVSPAQAAGPVPRPAYQPVYHVVRPGETLTSIGRLYGVTPFAIAQANNLMNPNLIYPGQRLIIPRGGVVYAAEAIVISQPLLSATVTSPVRVAGFADPTFEQNLTVQVRDQNGNVVGRAQAIIQADVGQRGPYSVDVTFTVPSGTQAGRIEVFAVSARDGNITHLSSVEVRLQRP